MTQTLSAALQEVRCHFQFGDDPHRSALSPDKPRYHIFDGLRDGTVLFDTEEEIQKFIGRQHLKMAVQFLDGRT